MIGVLDITRRLIAHDTMNPPGNERLCVGDIAGFLAELGWQARLLPFGDNGMNLIAELPGEDEDLAPLLLTGHLDTVPLGAAAWSTDPFGGAIIDGRIYGRGASDMKAGVAAMIVASLRYRDIRLRRGVTLILTGMEETGCLGATHLIGLRDPALQRASAILVGEPTSNRMITAHRGCLCVRAHYHGVTAHSSMPERGINAIYKAAHAVTRVAQFDFSGFEEPLLGKPTANVGMINGGMNVNSVPDHASFTTDIRTNVTGSNAVIRPLIYNNLSANSVETLIDVAAVSTDPDNGFASLIRRISNDRGLDQPPAGEAISFYTDASVLQPHFKAPAIILGPGEPGQAHQIDEYCRIDRITEAVELYADVINNWCEAG